MNIVSIERPVYRPAGFEASRLQGYRKSLYVRIPHVSFFRDAFPHDDAWESFTEDSLPSYLANGVSSARQNIDRLQNLSRPYSKRDERQLLFMTESLIQARRLLEMREVEQ